MTRRGVVTGWIAAIGLRSIFPPHGPFTIGFSNWPDWLQPIWNVTESVHWSGSGIYWGALFFWLFAITIVCAGLFYIADPNSAPAKGDKSAQSPSDVAGT